MEQTKTEKHERTNSNHNPKTDSTQNSNAANDSKTSSFSEDSSKSEDSNSNTSNTTSHSGASIDPNMDIDTPCWFYQDGLGLKQGPFSFREMFLWWKGGYFADTLLVRTTWEDHMTPLIQIPQFWNAPIKLVERIEKEHEESLRRGVEVPAANYSSEETSQTSTSIDAPKYETYVVTGGFNPLTGKFQKDDSSSHFASKGLPADRDTRMMAHYFDYNQYAQQMAAAAQEPKKKKQVKGSKKFWKDRKEKKKRAKLLAEYLAD